MSYQALLFCPDEKAARLVTQILSDLEFAVEACNEPFGAVKRLMAQKFDAVVVDCENEQNAALLFKSARNSSTNQSSLAVAVVEGQAGVAKAFRIGANLVLTKPINVEQSKGTLRVARGLLRKGEASKVSSIVAQESASAPSPDVIRQPSPGSMPAKIVTPKTEVHAQTPIAPAAESAAFELEAETNLKPEPAEAALMESMSTPTEAPSQAPVAGSASPKDKEYPWQRPSKPLAEPMASAMKKASEVAAKGQPHRNFAAVASALPSENKEAIKAQPITGGLSSNKGAATGTATARQTDDTQFEPPSRVASVATAIPEVDVKISEPETTETAVEQSGRTEIEPPTFSMGAEEPPSGGKSKAILLIAALVLLAAGGSYYGYNALHPAATSAQPSVQPPSPPAVKTSAPLDIVPSSANETAIRPTDETVTAPAAPKPEKTTSKPATSAVAPATKATSNQTAPQIVVKRAKASTASPVEDAVAPSATDISGNSGSMNGLAGIVGTAAAHLPSASNQTVKLSQGVSEGLLVKKVAPVYPAQAQQMRIQGAVELQAMIGKDGTITKVKALKGDSLLSRAATDAVKQWKYRPYLLNGEPVEIQTQVTVVFKLP